MEASLLVYNKTRLLVVMGVAGCGKSTIAAGLAEKLAGTYLDGDSYHPTSNIAKMSAGTPLTDDDRWPWLSIFAKEISSRSGIVVAACSALKRSYRDFITKEASEPVLFVYLDGTRELISKRMSVRTGHFMPTSLLDSQFAALEIPTEDEHHISIDISGTQDQIVADAFRRVSV